MARRDSAIPVFRSDGYLPVGLYLAAEADILFRFGTSNRQRRRLALRVRHWIELARKVGVQRLMIDGSFVTAKDEPNDVDAVVLLPSNFQEQLDQGLRSQWSLKRCC